MIANWNGVIERLRADLSAKGIRLPERPIFDSHWHSCFDGAAYLIFAHAPHTALARDANGSVTVWRAEDRLLSVAQQHRIEAALAALPQPAAPTASALGSEALQADARAEPPNTPTFAESWLRAVLAAGPVASVDVRQRAVANGFAWSAMRGAARRLGVVARRSGFGPRGAWRWELVDVLTPQPPQQRP
jgi:hypothetical protein